MRRRAYLPDVLLKHKKEGWYLVPLPIIAVDPDRGFLMGVLGELYDNGSRDDPFFSSTAFRRRIFFAAEYGTNDFFSVRAFYDHTYVAGSPWRLKSELGIERHGLRNYFGVGGDSMQPLTHPATGQQYRVYSEYKDSLAREQDGSALTRFNDYGETRLRNSTSAEVDLFGGIVRGLAGFQVAHYWLQEQTGREVDAKDANGNEVKATQATTKIREDCAAGRVVGCEGGFDNFLKLGISLDTRNFEPDPDYGVLAQIIGNFSAKFIGSEEDYIRLNTAVSGYYSLMPSITRLVAAARVLWSMSFGDVPFFTQPTYTFAGEDRFGLGGFFTFRGYQQGRFIGKVTALVNLELRWRFVEFQGWGQHFSVGITPFFETGRVYDEVSSAGLNDFFSNWQWSTGAGLRLGWNLSTLIALDMGVSEEHQTFFMMMGHQF